MALVYGYQSYPIFFDSFQLSGHLPIGNIFSLLQFWAGFFWEFSVMTAYTK